MKRNSFLAVLSILQLALFVPLAWWAHKHPLDTTDVKITRTLQKNHSPLLRYVSLFLSLVCSWQFMNIAAFPIAVALWKIHLRLEALMFVTVTVLCTFLRKVMQPIIGRPRPSPAMVHVEKLKSGKSFPSGHAATSIACWGWLIVLGNMLIKNNCPEQKVILSIPTLFIALAGPSRIYLGEHWTSDVVGGYLYGGAWLTLSLQLYLILKERGMLSETKRPGERNILRSHW